MLISLHIENYALIQSADIPFHHGFTVITGETGAGKSIILGALGLVLGGRADTAVLADKERKCIVEAVFDISGLALEPLFSANDVDYDERQLILRREITPSGKSRAFANDTPVQLAFLKQLGPRIIDIHSQHQTLTLAESTFRTNLLDTIAANSKNGSSTLTQYQDAYGKYTTLKHQLEELTATERQNRKDADYLQFQFDELSSANLHDGEQQELEQEQTLLSHAEAIRQGFAQASAAIDDDSDRSTMSALRAAKQALQHISPYHTEAADLLARLDSTIIELDDISSSMLTAADNLDYSPGRQQQVDDRLAIIYRLEKKHGVDTIADLLNLQSQFDERLQSISTLSSRIEELMEQVDRSFAALQAAAAALTASRSAAANELSTGITHTLAALGMKEASLTVSIQPSPSFGPTGADSIRFLFNANKGGQPRDIEKVASGGELSRLMLAIKSLLTSKTLLPTIIFDEIDTGVSGDIGLAVAGIMRSMAQNMQVIAISHLPQIAAQAGQHLKVYKNVESDRTLSHIKPLSVDQRIHEIAVMLSSEPPTQAALQTARELMQKT